MDLGKDEPDTTQDKNTGGHFRTIDPLHSRGEAMERPGTSIVSFLPSLSVIAEDGVTRTIGGSGWRGASRPEHALPFETQVHGHIGRQLRLLYDQVLDQPVPGRLLALLSHLDDLPPGDADAGESSD